MTAHLDFYRHIIACNALSTADLQPIIIHDKIAALPNQSVQNVITRMTDGFVKRSDGWHFIDSAESPEARTAILSDLCRKLRDENIIGPSRHENYAVIDDWQKPALATIDRSAAIALGVPSFGVHVNGFIRRHDGIHMWIGLRSRHKPVAPGKLDNMVAGGQPAGLTLYENVIKEAAEEASLPESVAHTARAVGLVRYALTVPEGNRFDTLYCYDLEMPENVIPTPGDDECEGFTLVHINDVLQRLATTDDFKFNVPLVIIDFAIRHGILSPETTANYTDLTCGLRQPFPLFHHKR